MSNQPPNIDFSKIHFDGTHSTVASSYGKLYGKKANGDNIIDSIDKLVEIADIDVVLEILDYKMAVEPEYAKSAERWSDIGLDDLDEVELIMEMEKRFDCFINDPTADKLTQMKPKTFLQLLIAKKRNERLDDLGIEEKRDNKLDDLGI